MTIDIVSDTCVHSTIQVLVLSGGGGGGGPL
jgi:hypothetical protein